MVKEYNLKHFRFIATIIMMILIIGILSFGVYAVARDNLGIANKTDFISGDENVFVQITGKYDGPKQEGIGTTASYYFKLTRDDREGYSNEEIAISPWNIGKTNFTKENTTISLTFGFQNLNGAKQMAINISNIAFDSKQKFTTAFITGETETSLDSYAPTPITASSQGENVTAIPSQYIDVSGIMYIRIIYTIVDFSSSFEFSNNVKVIMSSIL